MALVPGLTNDLAVQCLISVPYKFHRYLRAVSKSWNAVLSNPNFYTERRRHNLYEEGIASIRPYQDIYHNRFPRPWVLEVIVYYPLGKWWEMLPPFPKEFDLRGPVRAQCHCVYVKSKHHLVVMGLLSGERAAILMFDFSSRAWCRTIPELLELRPAWLFHPQAVTLSPADLVYLVYSPTWDILAIDNPHLYPFAYNLDENKLHALPPIEIERHHDHRCVGAFHNHKYYVFIRGQSVRIYDPRTGLWKRVNHREVVDHCVSAFGSLYCFDSTDGYNLIVKEYVDASDSFADVFSVQYQHLHRSRVYCTVPWQDCIFINSSGYYSGHKYYLFHVHERADEKRWTSIGRMPLRFPDYSFETNFATAMQI